MVLKRLVYLIIALTTIASIIIYSITANVPPTTEHSSASALQATFKKIINGTTKEGETTKLQVTMPSCTQFIDIMLIWTDDLENSEKDTFNLSAKYKNSEKSYEDDNGLIELQIIMPLPRSNNQKQNTKYTDDVLYIEIKAVKCGDAYLGPLKLIKTQEDHGNPWTLKISAKYYYMPQ